MKIERLLGIITLLMQRGKSTAPELAKRFDVSTRTIFRDVEDICKAGIPILTAQGGGGGISIEDSYRYSHNALTAEELRNVISSLKGLGGVPESPMVEQLLAKLSPSAQAVVSIKDSIVIDLDSHYKGGLAEKIGQVKSAIAANRLISFEYYTEAGRQRRIIEPYYIAFKWSAWYVFGFCMEKDDYRLFKLNRIWNIIIVESSFAPRLLPADDLAQDDYLADSRIATILFDRSAEYLVIEEYGPDSYETTPDGRLKLTIRFTNEKFIKRWVLGFGDKALVLEPKDLAEDLRETAQVMSGKYAARF